MKLFFEPVPHDEAADMIRRMPAVTRAVYDELAPEMRALAFVITGVDDATQLQAAKNILAKLPAGANYEDVKEELIAALPFAGKKAERRAELLLRHWGGIAYALSQYHHMQRQTDVFPWWQYQTMGDGKVRATHVALGGIVLRHDDPFWQGHYPPWEPLCRCTVIPLMDMDVEEMREQDKALPADQHRVLDGPLLKQLRDHNRLVRGMNNVFDVRTPEQKGEPWIGWQPGNLAAGINLGKVQAALQPDVFGKLKSFLQKQKLPNNGNVWDWWVKRQPKGAAAPVPAPAPAAPVQPAPAPQPPAPVPAAPTVPVPTAKPKKRAPQSPVKKPAAKPAPGSREAIESAVFTGEKPIGGGINGTFKLTNGETVLFKPSALESPASTYRRDVPDGTQWKREIAASLLHDALGFKILPPTARISYPGKGPGSAQLWAEGFSTAGEYGTLTGKRASAIYAAIPRIHREQWQLFDDIINHLDRHAFNYMVKPAANGSLELLLIDHGLALPAGTAAQGWGNNGKRFHGPLEGKPLTAASRKVLGEFLSQEAAIRQTLAPWLETEAIDLIFRRATRLQQRGTYGSVIL